MIKKTYSIKAPIHEVWSALTDRFYIQEWSGYPAVMDDKVGTQFSLWEGDIHGTNLEVVPQQRLVQNWFGGDWEAPSLVTMTLSEKRLESNEGIITTVDLEHTGIPPEETADFDAGWDDYYFGPMMEKLQPFEYPDEPELVEGVTLSDIQDESVFDNVDVVDAAGQPVSDGEQTTPPSTPGQAPPATQ